MLADVLAHDEAQDAALTLWQREPGDADHPGTLHAIWQGQTIEARRQAWRAAIRRELPGKYRDGRLDGGTATWLRRTLRSVEAAGLDAGQVAEDAIASAPLTGARDLAAVIDYRVRKATAGIAPAPWQPWSERAIGAYSELHGIESDTDPVGPEPVNSPEARSAWPAAYSAQLRQDPSGLDHLPDSSLYLRRAQYEAETRWAPPYPGRELRLVQQAQLDMTARQVRQQAEARAAQNRGDERAAATHASLAESARAAAAFYRARGDLDEQLHTARQEWATRTAPMRLAAVQADALLRRRHPHMRLEPLRSAEPEPLPDALPEPSAEANTQHAGLVAERLAAFHAEIECRAAVLISSEDPDYEPDGQTWPDLARPRRDALLQPPMPIMPAPQRQPEREPELQL